MLIFPEISLAVRVARFRLRVHTRLHFETKTWVPNRLLVTCVSQVIMSRMINMFSFTAG
jgi:hypothetical protein